VGTAFLLISVLVLVLFNSAAMDVSSAMTFLILGWLVGAPILAAFIRVRTQGRNPDQLPGHLGAGAVLTVVLVVAFYTASVVLAPGS
jgi:hypothetical protein